MPLFAHDLERAFSQANEDIEFVNVFVALRLVLDERRVLQYHEQDGLYQALNRAELLLRDRLEVISNGQYQPFECS